MSLRSHVEHYCLNTTTSGWPPWFSVCSCCPDGKFVVTRLSISMGLEINSWIRCFKPGMTCCVYFAREEVVWYCRMRRAGGLGDEVRWTINEFAWKHCLRGLGMLAAWDGCQHASKRRSAGKLVFRLQIAVRCFWRTLYFTTGWWRGRGIKLHNKKLRRRQYNEVLLAIDSYSFVKV